MFLLCVGPDIHGSAHCPDIFPRLGADPHINQNPLLMALTTVMVREHNRRARIVEDANPKWGDEEVFLEARK